MKIGAMVPQGWRMDLNGIKPEKQWDAICLLYTSPSPRDTG